MISYLLLLDFVCLGIVMSIQIEWGGGQTVCGRVCELKNLAGDVGCQNSSPFWVCTPFKVASGVRGSDLPAEGLFSAKFGLRF